MHTRNYAPAPQKWTRNADISNDVATKNKQNHPNPNVPQLIMPFCLPCGNVPATETPRDSPAKLARSGYPNPAGQLHKLRRPTAGVAAMDLELKPQGGSLRLLIHCLQH